MMIRYPDRIKRARLPTPVEPARRLSNKLGVELMFKRDDLTGSSLSGNKIRKLEFLFADAAAEGADTVITCGGEQSNHCRATAIAAAELGLRSYLLLRTDNPKEPPAAEANILLDRLVGADIRWVSREEYKRRVQLFTEVQGQLLAQRRKAYVIPEGGSNAVGAWGYVGCVDELAQELGDKPLTLVYAAGSGGTGAGLILGIKLLKLPWRAVGINVCDDKPYFVEAIGDIVEAAIKKWLMPIEFDRSEIEIVDGYVGVGYAKSRPEELQTIRDVARTEGLILDPVYTGKAFHGMTKELERDKAAFGSRICFIHTGGIYGLFPKAKELEAIL
jgi:D-cysteine desulfhydrase